MSEEREVISLDVLLVGGGPANLAAAIRLMQLAKEKGMSLEVGLIEKGDSLGAHCLSGAILDPAALTELMPDYRDQGCPIEQYTCRDKCYFLTPRRAIPIPFTPGYIHNDGCHIISLSAFVRWLGEMAEALGVMIFPGIAGVEVLYDEKPVRVTGVRSGNKGIDRNGIAKRKFEQGLDLMAHVTVFGEGSKGSLLREVGGKMGIFSERMPQIYETSFKEVIELSESSRVLESDITVFHSFGYPLGLGMKGGGFLYKMRDNRVSLGMVVGLDYHDPLFEPYEAFMRMKQHPLISEIIRDGKVLQWGAKTLCAGGYWSIPKLAVNGALFVGDSASMLNVQRLKGIHTAMKSGMLAAETIMEAFARDDFSEKTLAGYPERVEQSWIPPELYKARNFTQALGMGFPASFVHLGLQYITNGRGVVGRMATEPDSQSLKKVQSGFSAGSNARMKFDGVLCVDKLTGVYLSNTRHEENQPCHIKVHDPDICVNQCYELYRNPCTRFCPGSVYEMGEDEETLQPRLKLNPANCLHCKTCEIKDPFDNISWTCPEGGGGPGYTIV